MGKVRELVDKEINEGVEGIGYALKLSKAITPEDNAKMLKEIAKNLDKRGQVVFENIFRGYVSKYNV